MIVNQELCIGCGQCIPYCGLNAMQIRGGKVEIDLVECVECGVCMRTKICPVGAIEQQELDLKRSIRKQFSDPLTPHPSTTLAGRGTEEIKTNDVTGRVPAGKLGMGVEMGRPGFGVWMYDVEKVAKAIAPIGVEWEICNPLTELIVDKATGDMAPDLQDIKVLSCILEFTIDLPQLEALLLALRAVEGQVNTVFSVSMISVFDREVNLPGLDVVRQLGIEPRCNPKINLGLGRPLAVGLQ